LCDYIRSLRARTLAGFAVQARAASLQGLDLWDDDEDHARELAFIAAACAFAGVTPVSLMVPEVQS
jgi:hypothetical protein